MPEHTDTIGLLVTNATVSGDGTDGANDAAAEGDHAAV